MSSSEPPRKHQRLDPNALVADKNDAGNKDGYDVGIFVDQSRVSDHICTICRCVFNEPASIGCDEGHVYCKQCLVDFFKDNDSKPCPLDQQMVHKRNIASNKYVERLINSLRVVCPLQYQQSSSSNDRSNGQAKVDCEWTGCLSDMRAHTREQCGLCVILCQYCGVEKQRRYMNQHVNICDETPVPCPLHCSNLIKRKLVQSHVDVECGLCGMQSVNCDDCKASVLRKDLKVHQAAECDERMSQCPYAHYGCTQMVKANELQAHVAQNEVNHLQLKVEHLENENQFLHDKVQNLENDEGDKPIAAAAPAPSSQNELEEMSPVKHEQPKNMQSESTPAISSYLPTHPSAMEQQLMNGEWTEPAAAFNGLDGMLHDFDGDNLFDEFDDFDAFDPMNDIGDMPDRLPETFSTLQPHDDDIDPTTTTHDMQTIVDANHHHHHQTPVHENKHENEHRNVSIQGLQASLLEEIPEEDEMPEPNDDEENETNDTSRKRYRYNYTAPDSACMEPQAKRRKIDDSHTTDPTVGVDTKSVPMAMTIAPECIHSQFEDWTQEFCYILEQTDESVIASHSHSIVCRWTFPSNDVDKTNDAKSVAHSILDLLLNQDFAATFDTDDDNEDDDDGSGGGCGAAAVGFFAENNRTKYLSYLTDCCDILTRLNRFYESQKKNLRSCVRNVCKKIMAQKLFVGQVVFDTHPHKLCFVCGLFSIVCKALRDRASFWRVVLMLMLMDQCDLDECALLFAVMFECFPQQIADTAFVQSCCKTVMCSHYHSICAKLETTTTTTTRVNRLRIAKERYQRLMNVVSSQWNTIPVVSAHRNAFMQAQFDQIIAQNASNAEIVDDTTVGVNVTCRGDIRYAVNELIPRVIYPTLLHQFKKQKTNVQIFLIDVWSECVSNVCAVLQTKCHDQQCALIKEPFINVLQQIVMCYMQSDQLVVFPVVVVCCLRHLLAMQTHTALERVITKFVSSDEQLWKFTTNVLKTWKTRIDSLSGKEKLAERKARIAVFMKIIQTVCSRKSYSMEVFQSLKKEHVPK